MERLCDWIEGLLVRGEVFTPSEIHRARQLGLGLRRIWFALPSEMRQFLRSTAEFLFRIVIGWHTLVIGGVGGTVALIEKLLPAFSISVDTWWKLLWAGLAVAVMLAFHKVRKERDALLPRSLDGLKALIGRGRSADWMTLPTTWSFYPGGVDAWIREDNDWFFDVTRELGVVSKKEHLNTFVSARLDPDRTPIVMGAANESQQDRWRTRFARLEVLEQIIQELES